MKALCLLAALLSSSVRADDVYKVIVQKQEKKAENRWSLSQWLEQKDRMRFMDLWLAIHSPSPYEFFLSAEYQFGRTNGSTGFNSNTVRLGLAAYASLFGLELQKDFQVSQWAAYFNLRIFGMHVQATNLTLHGGLRSRKDPSTYLNPAAGLSLTFYLSKYFGIAGLYRHYLGPLHNDGGIDETGNRFEAEAFIDFSFWRIYLQAFSDTVARAAGPAATVQNRDGAAIGAKLFF